jgi:two-component system NtrC family response regulator
VELLADRFAVVGTDCAVDLATGEAAALMVSTAGGPSDQMRWAERCEYFMSLRHRRIAQLLDYGCLGEHHRFEAWRCGRAWSGSRHAARAASQIAARFFEASGRTACATSDLREHHGQPVVLPNADAGYAHESASQQPSIPLEDCGIRVQPRLEWTALSELLDARIDRRPTIVTLWGNQGIGKTTTLLQLARTARLAGYVPVGVGLVHAGSFDELLRGRSLFLIGDEARRPWQALLRATMATPKAHVLVLAGELEIPLVEGLALTPLAADTLAASVQPVSTSQAALRVRRASLKSAGSPGRFVRLLWPRAACDQYARVRRLSVAAEQAATYGMEDAPTIDSSRIDGFVAAWPTAGELRGLRRRLDAARELLTQGRHAPGERGMRQVIGALARRGDYRAAGEGALDLAASVLRRGRTRDAQALIEDGRDYLRRDGNERPLARAATLAGVVWTDLARLDEAETLLGAALAAVRTCGDSADIASVSLALARCQFWAGRYGEADRLLDTISDSHELIRIKKAVLRSRIAVGLGDMSRAAAAASQAVRDSRSTGDSNLIAIATCASAFAHLTIDDHEACVADVFTCIGAARTAHDPLCAVRVRLLGAESARRKGSPSEAHQLLRHARSAALPPIVRARFDVWRGLMEAPDASAELVSRHVAATGLQALALFAPQPTARKSSPIAVEHLLEVLRLCQTADDERAILSEICRRLRRHLRAAAVGFLMQESARLVVVASEGNRLETEIGERAVAARMSISPHRCGDRIEAAAPLEYGGDTIGAVIVRWTLGQLYDRSDAPEVLAIVAAAAAPVVAAMAAHRSGATQKRSIELIGESGAMLDIRRTIDRAARAPFPVLIQAESGTGKELVARAVHRSGQRGDRPFCTLNCAALPDDLVEGELFGHTRGAFTGAMADRPGVFEEAHGGTLFLDEIGELSLRAQAKVLRVLQEGEVKRVGENVPRRVDVRIVAATNRDLHADVEAGRFRLDLLYRLDVVRIAIPPLRERCEDIAPLAEHFWREATARVGCRATLAAETISALARYRWPGNVRELQNVLAAIAVRAPKRGVVPPSALPACFGETRACSTWRLDEARRSFEERFVRAALVRSGGRRGRAASELGLTRQGLTKLMARLGIE